MEHGYPAQGTRTREEVRLIETIEENRRARRGAASPMATVEEAIEEYRRGRFVIIVDDEDRENEGDLCMPAQFVTPEAISFMLRHTSGIICVPHHRRAPGPAAHPADGGQTNKARFGTAFTVSVDARDGVTTGVSAADRAQRHPGARRSRLRGPHDLVMPGHIYPLRAREGGVLVRAGHTEATVDLCKLAGLEPAPSSAS